MSHGQRMLRAEARRRREEDGLPEETTEEEKMNNNNNNSLSVLQQQPQPMLTSRTATPSPYSTPIKKGASLVREDGYLRENYAFAHETRTPSRAAAPHATASPAATHNQSNNNNSNGMLYSAHKSSRTSGRSPAPQAVGNTVSSELPQKKSRTAGLVPTTTTLNSPAMKKRVRANSHSVSPPPVTSRASAALVTSTSSNTSAALRPTRSLSHHINNNNNNNSANEMRKERRAQGVAVIDAGTTDRPASGVAAAPTGHVQPVCITTTAHMDRGAHAAPLVFPASLMPLQDENSNALPPSSPPLRAAVSPRTLPTQPSAGLHGHNELSHMRLEHTWRPPATGLLPPSQAAETCQVEYSTQCVKVRPCLSPPPSSPPAPSPVLLGEPQQTQTHTQRSVSKGSEGRAGRETSRSGNDDERPTRRRSRSASHSPPLTVDKMHYGGKAWQRCARDATSAEAATSELQRAGKRARSERRSPRALPANTNSTVAATTTTTAASVAAVVPNTAPAQVQPSATAMTVKPIGQPSALQMHESYPASSLALLENDCSGFANIGNDCYACSVLTMLLRSPRFRRELARSPYMQLLRRYETLVAAKLQGTFPGYDPNELHRLRAVLQMGVRKGRGIAPTVHAALAGFVAAQQRRDALRHRLVTHEAKTLAERVRLIRDVLRLDKTADLTKVVHTFCDGVSLAPLVPFFDDVFFTGAQEDAHELLVCLIARLEQECMDFAKHYNAVLTSGSHATSPASLISSSTSLPATNDTVNTSEGKSEEAKAARPSAPAGVPSLPPVPTSIWINDLLQGRLLNIVRCRNAQCGHEIVTLEPYVNVSVSIESKSQGTAPEPPQQPAAQAPAPATVMSPVHSDAIMSVAEEEGGCALLGEEAACAGAADDAMPATQLTTNIAAAATAVATTTALCSPPHPVTTVSETQGTTASNSNNNNTTTTNNMPSCAEPPPLLSQLLRRSVRYTPLEGYKCDVCGREARQYQGGCFYGTPPPILIVQVKRFLQRFTSDGRVVFTKVHAAVRVDDPLVVYALPDHTQNKEETSTTYSEEEEEEEDGEVYYDAEGKCFSAALHAKEAAEMATTHHTGSSNNEQEEDDNTSNTTESSCTEEDEAGEDSTSGLIRAIRAVYRLQGTVLHLGPNLCSGHYVAEFAVNNANNTSGGAEAATWGAAADTPRHAQDTAAQKRPPGTLWRLADNAFVHDETTMAEAGARRGTYAASRNKRCYLALYEKVRETRVRCPVWRVLPDARHLPRV